MSKYFYDKLSHYLSIYIRENDAAIEISHKSSGKKQLLRNSKVYVEAGQLDATKGSLGMLIGDNKVLRETYIILNGVIHYTRDIQGYLQQLSSICNPETRFVITYYSRLWQPLFRLATALGLRNKDLEQNWIAKEDIHNLLELSGFESLIDESRILIPIYIPLISNFVNRYLAPLPFFRIFSMLHIMIARPNCTLGGEKPSVSIVIPARNEAGNIENAILRMPVMGPDDELIFVEGNSTDNTWEVIQEIKKKYPDRNILIAQQDGKGKGDAVRKGFSLASKDILMILDADLTVPPESLPSFYDAIVANKGEFINGSRLVYPMDEKAMRFFNVLGNKFFAMAFSFVLGQRFKDTLCGTKVLTKSSYSRIAQNRNYFGEFDPFGDFDLIFGAMRLALKIREVPISYKERTYGETNIERWKHGVILLRMLLYAARKIKFV